MPAPDWTAREPVTVLFVVDLYARPVRRRRLHLSAGDASRGSRTCVVHSHDATRAAVAPPFECAAPRNWHFPDMSIILDVVRGGTDVVHIQYHNEDYDAVEMISALPLC